jgi:predicted Zn-dependent protease
MAAQQIGRPIVVGAVDRNCERPVTPGTASEDDDCMDDAAFSSGDRSDGGHSAGGQSVGGRGAPADEGPYDWYTRGLRLLENGSASAAEQLLARAVKAEPTSRSALEALGRAQFEARHYARAKATFARIIEADPTDDYGQFALGLSAARVGDVRTAVEHLALATAMRPGVAHYERELAAARARLGIAARPAHPRRRGEAAPPDDAR